MIYDVLSKIKKEVNIMMWLTIILALLIVSGVYTYARYTYHKEVTSISVKIPATSCSSLGLTLSDCVVAFEGGIEDIDRAKANIEAKGEPDFSVTATTDEGLYAASDDYGTSYYYRGAIDDNYVEYAGYLWRIVRINGDGSVRLILDENYTTSAFNEDYDDNAYIGYMYGTASSSTYNDTHENKNNSTIKTVVDEFYTTYIKDKTDDDNNSLEDYLSDTLFCNDRSIYSGDGYGTVETFYSGYNRLYTETEPTLTCTNQNDEFTVGLTTLDDGTKIGNETLSYPIGLITADEVEMAGAIYGTENYDYYLYTGYTFWTMTSSYFSSTYNLAFEWSASGGLYYSDSVDNSYGVRPVINLSSEVYVTSGKGTYDEPYTVALLDTLSNIMLINSTGESTVEDAEAAIEAKGTPDYSIISPTPVYVDNLPTNITTATASSRTMSTTYQSYYYTYADSYEFDSSTGTYSLVDAEVGQYSSIYSDLIGKYVVSYSGSTSSTAASSTSRSTIYYITDATTESTLYYISSSKTTNYDTSSSGLYAAEDDYGTSYYYCGAVEDNYVSFAGYTWRIVRRNGDGSVRLIMEDNLDYVAYNENYANNAFVGYMYGSFDYDKKSSSTASITMSSSSTYYFATSYTYDTTTGLYSLSGTLKSGKWSSIYSSVISTYPYTCLSTSSTGTCAYLIEITSRTSSTVAKGYYHTLGESYDKVHANTNDSTIKAYLDSWYEENLISYKDYISDEIFCNDRSVYSGTGYGYSDTLSTLYTYYGSFNRLYNIDYEEDFEYSPTLSCPQQHDAFTVSDTTNGNGDLTYPIGLITADEVAMAGGVAWVTNTNYYLYNGDYWWTMTPSGFNASSANAWNENNGGFYLDYYVSDSSGARPVVNLSSEVLVASGIGTADNPYILKLNTD